MNETMEFSKDLCTFENLKYEKYGSSKWDLMNYSLISTTEKD